jgi:hypothetical protein
VEGCEEEGIIARRIKGGFHRTMQLLTNEAAKKTFLE